MNATFSGVARSMRSAVLLLALAVTPITSGQTETARTVADQNGDIAIINVGIGRSHIVTLPWPAIGVSISQPSTANVQLLTPSRILVNGLQLGGAALVAWGEGDEVWQADVQVVVDLTFIELELERIFPDASLSISQSQDVVVVRGQLRRTSDVAHLKALLDSYDLKYVDTTSVAGVQQVMLRVRIAEVSREAIRALGINGFYGGDDIFGASLVGSDRGGPLNPVSIFPEEGAEVGSFPFLFSEGGVSGSVTLFGGLPGADLALFLEALSENQYVRVLAEPTLVALSGEEATFLAGGEFPIPVVQGGDQAGTSITVEYKQFGVTLVFAPVVLGDGKIRLRVAPEVSEVSDFAAVVIEGFEIPSVLSRRAETTLEMHSGQTFAIAGLFRQSTAARRSVVPVLGDLPVLGPLFRSVRYVTGETELVVMVTAALVEPLSEAADWPVPGDLHVAPDDWELFVNGQIQGREPGALAPADSRWLRDMGLDRLIGPGAWVTTDQGPAPVIERVEPMTRFDHGDTTGGAP